MLARLDWFCCIARVAGWCGRWSASPPRRQSRRAHRGLRYSLTRHSSQCTLSASAAALIKTFPHWDRSERLYAPGDNARSPNDCDVVPRLLQCCDLWLVIISYRIIVDKICFNSSHIGNNK